MTDQPEHDNAHMPLYGPFVSLVVMIVVLAAGYVLYEGFGRHVTFHAKPEVDFIPADTTVWNDLVENDIHVQTGLVYGSGFDAVRKNCTACHSAQLITQNRATREGWHQMIRWMQETQGLWDLGAQEATILDYLAEHYAPAETGRRPNLNQQEIEWYVLDIE